MGSEKSVLGIFCTNLTQLGRGWQFGALLNSFQSDCSNGHLVVKGARPGHPLLPHEARLVGKEGKKNDKTIYSGEVGKYVLTPAQRG